LLAVLVAITHVEYVSLSQTAESEDLYPHISYQYSTQSLDVQLHTQVALRLLTVFEAKTPVENVIRSVFAVEATFVVYHHDIYQYVVQSERQGQSNLATTQLLAVFALVIDVEKTIRSVVTAGSLPQSHLQQKYQYCVGSFILQGCLPVVLILLAVFAEVTEVAKVNLSTISVLSAQPVLHQAIYQYKFQSDKHSLE